MKASPVLALALMLAACNSCKPRPDDHSIGRRTSATDCETIERCLSSMPTLPVAGFQSKMEQASFDDRLRRSLQDISECSKSLPIAAVIVRCNEAGALKGLAQEYGYYKLAAIAERCYWCALNANDAEMCANILLAQATCGGDIRYLAFNMLYQEQRCRSTPSVSMSVMNILAKRDSSAFESIVRTVFAHSAEGVPPLVRFQAEQARSGELALDLKTLDAIAAGNWELLGAQPLIRAGN